MRLALSVAGRSATRPKRPERRRSIRLPLRHPFEFTRFWIGPNAPEFRKERSQELSEHGLSFTSKEGIQPKTLLKLRIYIPQWAEIKRSLFDYSPDLDPEPFTVLGKVVWLEERPRAKGYQVGIDFVAMDPADQQTLLQYLRKKNSSSARTRDRSRASTGCG